MERSTQFRRTDRAIIDALIRQKKNAIIQNALSQGIKIKDNDGFISQAERQCVNARVQGSAADITKLAMIEINNDPIMKELDFHLLIQVHDEVIGECPEENAKKAGVRIRGRDGAVEVAQQVIDSLGRTGLASLKSDTVHFDDLSRTWRGQPGVVPHDMTVRYSAFAVVSPDSVFTASDSSDYDKVSHVFAKRIDVTVSWPFKNSTQSISISRIIR